MKNRVNNLIICCDRKFCDFIDIFNLIFCDKKFCDFIEICLSLLINTVLIVTLFDFYLIKTIVFIQNFVNKTNLKTRQISLKSPIAF